MLYWIIVFQVEQIKLLHLSLRWPLFYQPHELTTHRPGIILLSTT